MVQTPKREQKGCQSKSQGLSISSNFIDYNNGKL